MFRNIEIRVYHWCCEIRILLSTVLLNSQHTPIFILDTVRPKIYQSEKVLIRSCCVMSSIMYFYVTVNQATFLSEKPPLVHVTEVHHRSSLQPLLWIARIAALSQTDEELDMLWNSNGPVRWMPQYCSGASVKSPKSPSNAKTQLPPKAFVAMSLGLVIHLLTGWGCVIWASCVSSGHGEAWGALCNAGPVPRLRFPTSQFRPATQR